MAIAWDGSTTAPAAPINGSDASVDGTGITITLPTDTQAVIVTMSAAGAWKRGAHDGTGVWISIPANTPRTLYGLGATIGVKAASGTTAVYVEVLDPTSTRMGR